MCVCYVLFIWIHVCAYVGEYTDLKKMCKIKRKADNLA
jgi:hypothetical protein